MDLGGVSRRQVRTFQGERRQKTRKFIAYGLIGSSPLRLLRQLIKPADNRKGAFKSLEKALSHVSDYVSLSDHCNEI